MAYDNPSSEVESVDMPKGVITVLMPYSAVTQIVEQRSVVQRDDSPQDNSLFPVYGQ